MKVNNKKGFTLIELLIVVVIIGILAAIAIPKFAATKEKAYLATMKTDLRNLSTAEEGYASSNAGAYIPANAAITSAAAWNNYQPSTGITVALPAPVTNGWSATASSANTTKKCYIFGGLGTPPNAAATQDGVPGCDP